MTATHDTLTEMLALISSRYANAVRPTWHANPIEDETDLSRASVPIDFYGWRIVTQVRSVDQGARTRCRPSTLYNQVGGVPFFTKLQIFHVRQLRIDLDGGNGESYLKSTLRGGINLLVVEGFYPVGIALGLSCFWPAFLYPPRDLFEPLRLSSFATARNDSFALSNR